MLLFSLAEDEDVVHVDTHDSLINEFLEDVIHHHLEHCWAVSETKEHDQGFKQALVCPEACLLFVPFFDPHIVISPTDVKLSEVLCFSLGHFIEDVWDQWEGVGCQERCLGVPSPTRSQG